MIIEHDCIGRILGAMMNLQEPQMGIDRISYDNRGRSDAAIEIVTLQQFFAERPSRLIEKDYRLDFWSMIYVTEGEVVHSIDFTEYPCTAGDLLVLSKNQVHSYRKSSSVRGYVINLDEAFFTGSAGSRDMDLLAFFETPYGHPVLSVDISEGATSRVLIDLIYEEYRKGDAAALDLAGSLFVSFIQSIRNENQESIHTYPKVVFEHYHAFRELVEQHFTDFRQVKQYEDLMGLHTKTINASCRECAGITAKQLIIHRLVLEVKRLLVQGELKNYEISYALGFEEPANLAGFFKRYTGMSMKEFRASAHR